MKTLLTITALFAVAGIHAQSPINQQTEHGQKTGQWVENYENGKTKKVSYYEPITRKMRKADAFFEGITAEEDAYRYEEKLLWTETYEYLDNWELKRVKRMERSQPTIYLYGPHQEIAISTDHLYVVDKVSDSITVRIELTNRSNESIALNVESNQQYASTGGSALVIPGKQDAQYSFQLQILPGTNEGIITLMNDSIVIDLTLRTFGYHVGSADMEQGDSVRVKDQLVYHRTGSEALLMIFDSSKTKKLQTISLARREAYVELDQLEAGSYWLCIKDYSADSETFCPLKIEP